MTPEAIEPLFEKRMDGFSIAFHMLSHAKIGTSTVQSRATAGVAGATFIFCLPGSPGACRDAWDGILAAQLDYRTRPCNFVEIMPRLDEHLRRPKAQGAQPDKALQPAEQRGYRAARRAGILRECMGTPDIEIEKVPRGAARCRDALASQLEFPGFADQVWPKLRCGSVATSLKPAS